MRQNNGAHSIIPNVDLVGAELEQEFSYKSTMDLISLSKG